MVNLARERALQKIREIGKLTCEVRGKLHVVMLMIPDDLWQHLSQGKEIICPTCLMSMVEDGCQSFHVFKLSVLHPKES